jgi:uncharacterized membrane protein
MEAFSDGVFAIAITLLVLELAVPANAEGDLLGAIVDAWPSYLAYLVSFATVGAIWLSHNAVTEYLDGVDSTFLRLNLLLLMVVSFLPFPTRLLAEHLRSTDAERVAVTIYGLNLLLAVLIVSGLWRWARRAHLERADAPAADLKLLDARLTPGLAGYLAITLIGLVFPIAAVVGYLVLALFILLPVGSIRAARRWISTS